MNKKFLCVPLLLLTLLAPLACRNKKEHDPGAAFDRGAMLLNISGNLVKPGYENLQLNLGFLRTAVNDLLQNTNTGTLVTAQDKWLNAFIAFQRVNAFNFGPAAEQGVNKSFMEELSTFPASATKIENFITANDTLFANFDRDSRGFLAIEYLLYGTSDNNAVVNALASANRKNYLRALVHHLEKNTQKMVTAWNGSYFNQFVGNNGTDAGSSVTQLYNEFLKSYEVLKNYEVGLPAGKRPGQTQAEPDKVIAFYSKHSVEIMKEHFATIERIWKGNALNGTNGTGFHEYLGSVVGGEQLIKSTLDQMDRVHLALDAIPNNQSFSGLIAANSVLVDDLNTELQKLTRYIKSDMSSLLGLTITYSSGDGD